VRAVADTRSAPLSPTVSPTTAHPREASVLPLSRDLGTYKTVKARFWPWLEPFSGKSIYVSPFLCSLGSGLQANTRWGSAAGCKQTHGGEWRTSGARQRRNLAFCLVFSLSFSPALPPSPSVSLALSLSLYVCIYIPPPPLTPPSGGAATFH